MNNFNLLPWRENLRRRKLKFIITMVNSILLITCSAVFIYQIKILRQIRAAEEKNYAIKNEIGVLLPKYRAFLAVLKREKLLAKKAEQVRKLYIERMAAAGFFKSLGDIIPDNTIVNYIRIDGSKVRIGGAAPNNQSITDLWANIENNGNLSMATILEIKNCRENKAVSENLLKFTLEAILTK